MDGLGDVGLVLQVSPIARLPRRLGGTRGRRCRRAAQARNGLVHRCSLRNRSPPERRDVMNPAPGCYGVVDLRGVFPWLIRHFTRSEYSHAFIYLGFGYILEAQPRGSKISPLSRYDGLPMLFSEPAPGYVADPDVNKAQAAWLGIEYGFEDIAWLGLDLGLGIKWGWLLDRVAAPPTSSAPCWSPNGAAPTARTGHAARRTCKKSRPASWPPASRRFGGRFRAAQPGQRHRHHPRRQCSHPRHIHAVDLGSGRDRQPDAAASTGPGLLQLVGLLLRRARRDRRRRRPRTGTGR